MALGPNNIYPTSWRIGLWSLTLRRAHRVGDDIVVISIDREEATAQDDAPLRAPARKGQQRQQRPDQCVRCLVERDVATIRDEPATMQDTVQSANPSRRRVTWNKGKLTGAKPPLRPKHVWSIRSKLQLENRVRDLAMFNLAIDSKLRGCDVVAPKVEDVAPHGRAVDRATVRQKKTGRPVRFELTEPTRESVDAYLRQASRRPGEFLFPGRGQANSSMTTRQYARLAGQWIGAIGLDSSFFGTHSLRRTKATLIYRRTGNLRAVQPLLGHTKIENTIRYLGIEIDDALTLAEQVDI